jgi:hypothetical protein
MAPTTSKDKRKYESVDEACDFDGDNASKSIKDFKKRVGLDEGASPPTGFDDVSKIGSLLATLFSTPLSDGIEVRAGPRAHTDIFSSDYCCEANTVLFVRSMFGWWLVDGVNDA